MKGLFPLYWAELSAVKSYPVEYLVFARFCTEDTSVNPQISIKQGYKHYLHVSSEETAVEGLTGWPCTPLMSGRCTMPAFLVALDFRTHVGVSRLMMSGNRWCFLVLNPCPQYGQDCHLLESSKMGEISVLEGPWHWSPLPKSTCVPLKAWRVGVRHGGGLIPMPQRGHGRALTGGALTWCPPAPMSFQNQEGKHTRQEAGLEVRNGITRAFEACLLPRLCHESPSLKTRFSSHSPYLGKKTLTIGPILHCASHAGLWNLATPDLQTLLGALLTEDRCPDDILNTEG